MTMSRFDNGILTQSDPIGAERTSLPLPALSETAVRIKVANVGITNISITDAVATLTDLIESSDERTRLVYFANAHTLNLACKNPAYRAVLNAADHVFGDGTGVRWAARFGGARMCDNVNGTDVVPLMFEALAGRGRRYFLLGARPGTIDLAAAGAQMLFPGWELAGYHHGYLDPASTTEVIKLINESEPHVLLVGMGNPLQELWLNDARGRLKVPLCMGTGGLFEYWAGNLDRAPIWYRRIGIEWMHILRRQPHKLGRYMLGGPAFLARALQRQLQES